MFYKSWMWIIHAPLSNIFTLSPALWPGLNTRGLQLRHRCTQYLKAYKLVPVDNAVVGARMSSPNIVYIDAHWCQNWIPLLNTPKLPAHSVQRQMKIYDRWNLKSRFFCIFWISAQPGRKSRDTSIRTFLKSTVSTFLLLFLCIGISHDKLLWIFIQIFSKLRHFTWSPQLYKILRTFLIECERKNSGQVWKGCQAFLADVLSQKEFMPRIFPRIALKFLTPLGLATPAMI